MDNRGEVPLVHAAYFGNGACIGFRLAQVDRDVVQAHARRNAEKRGIAPTTEDMDRFAETVPALLRRLQAASVGPSP